VPEREFQPPSPVGEPYRADPTGPAPFVREGEKVPTVPVEAAEPVAPGRPVTGPPYGYPRPEAGRSAEGRPQFRPPDSRPVNTPVDPVERYARTAMWLGVASIFIFNLFFGPAAIVMGIISIRRGEKKLGRQAIIFGAVGTFVGILYLVLVAVGVLPTFDEMLNDIRNRS
jgi:hypothetical protein